MPYILKIERSELDPIVSEMGEKIDGPGKLAYVIFAWFKRHVFGGDANRRNFFNLALYIGTLVLVIFEIVRRFIGVYEDGKIADPLHGDVE